MNQSLRGIRLKDVLIYDVVGIILTITIFYALAFRFHTRNLVLMLTALAFPLAVFLLIKRKLKKLGVNPAESIGAWPQDISVMTKIFMLSIATYLFSFCFRELWLFFRGIELGFLWSANLEKYLNSDIFLFYSIVFPAVGAVHRVVLLNSLTQRWSIKVSVLITVLLFSLPSIQANGFISSLAGETILALIYITTGSIVNLYFANVIMSLCSWGLLTWAMRNKIAIYSMSTIAQYQWLFIVISTVTMVIILGYIYQTRAVWKQSIKINT